MSRQHENERDGGEKTAEGGAALRIASSGLSTIRDCANFTAALAVDALTGHIGARNGNLAIRGMESTRRFIETGQRHGQHSQVLDRIGHEANGENANLAREAELTAELEALRERRGA